jgi:hypothetical protein
LRERRRHRLAEATRTASDERDVAIEPEEISSQWRTQ